MSERLAASIILSHLCPPLQSSLKSGCVSRTDLISISFPDAQNSPAEKGDALARQGLWWGRSTLEQNWNANCQWGHVCLLAYLFWGRSLQAGRPPSPSGPAAGACVPGTAAKQIRGEVDLLHLENWVAHGESWQCCKFLRGRSNTEGTRGGNHLYTCVWMRQWICRRLGVQWQPLH